MMINYGIIKFIFIQLFLFFIPLKGMNNKSSLKVMTACDRESCEDIIFISDKDLYKHLCFHLHESFQSNQEKYKCPILGCHREFKHLSLAKIHMLYHTDYRPHLCEICNKKFHEKKALDLHNMSQTHKERIEQQKKERPSFLVYKVTNSTNLMKYNFMPKKNESSQQDLDDNQYDWIMELLAIEYYEEWVHDIFMNKALIFQ